jgi:hypothetical protein
MFVRKNNPCVCVVFFRIRVIWWDWVHSVRRLLLGWIMMISMEQLVGCELAGETEVSGETLPQCHFTTDFTLPYLRSNPGHRGGKPVTNRMRYGTAFFVVAVFGFSPRVVYFVGKVTLGPKFSTISAFSSQVPLQQYFILNHYPGTVHKCNCSICYKLCSPTQWQRGLRHESVFAGSNTGIVSSKLTQSMDFCVRLFCV